MRHLPAFPLRVRVAGLCLVSLIGGILPVVGAGTTQRSFTDPNSSGMPNTQDTQQPPIVPQNPPWHDGTGTKPQQDPKALEILKAGLKAMGGEEAILGRKTIFLKRKVTNHDYPEPREGTVTIWYKRPNKIRKEINYAPDPTRVEAYDGQTGWFDDGTGPKIWTQGTRTAAILDGLAELDLPANYLDAELTYFNISQEIPGKLAHVVKVRKNGYTKELMFDVASGLLQVTGQYENPWGADDKMTRYDRYRPVDGILIPWREERWRANRMVTESEIIDVKFNGPIDDAIFQVPTGSGPSRP